MNTPRIRRGMLIGSVVVVLTLLLSACMSPEQTRAHDALNRDRRTHRLAALPTHETLNKKAQAWAEKIARDNRLSHSNLSQGLPSCYRAAGENVGYSSTIEATQTSFMNSPRHRANVLDRKWTHVGVGVARNGNRWFTVQVFLQGC